MPVLPRLAGVGDSRGQSLACGGPETRAVQIHGVAPLLPEYYSAHLRWGNFLFHGG